MLLGKANLSEWANFRSLRSSSGWSALGGQARNPHDTSRSVCGSSSGSAIAVAAGLAVAAVGTETDGSVICPASLCGVIGFKPAVGELSQAGIVPVAHSQDTAGPITGCVVDAAIMAAAMAGRDHSPLVSALAQGRPEDFLAGRRLGVVGANAGYGPPVEALFAATLDQLRRAGVVIVEDLVFARPKGLGRAMFEVLSCEFKHDLNAYLASLPGEFGRLRLRDLIVFNQSHAEEEMPHFGQELFELAESKPGLDDASYREALRFAQATTREGGIDQLIEEHSLDALITPSSVPAWPIDHAVGDPNAPASSSYPAVAGYPHITLPMGTVAGHPSKPPVQLPVGLSVFTQPSRRDSLFQIARGCELLAPARPQPML